MGTTLIEITGENPVALSYTVDLHTGYNLLSNPFKNETTVEKLFQFSEIPLNAEVYNTAGVKLATYKLLNRVTPAGTLESKLGWDVNASIPTGTAYFLYIEPGRSIRVEAQGHLTQYYRLTMLGSAVINGYDIKYNTSRQLVAGNNFIAPLIITPTDILTLVPIIDGMQVFLHTGILQLAV